MNLYLLTQDEVDDYDTYDSCVVVAESEEESKKIHPSGIDSKWLDADYSCWSDWATSTGNVKSTLLGESADKSASVVCASFNAG